MTEFSPAFLNVRWRDTTLTLVMNDDQTQEQLYLNDVLVSEQPVTHTHSAHQFQCNEQDWRFQYQRHSNNLVAFCQVHVDGKLLHETAAPITSSRASNGETSLPDIRLEPATEQSTRSAQAKNKSGLNFITLAAIGMKLLKSAKVIQVTLVGASLASYSFLFDWRFAVIIVMALMFHEFGHMQAMKKMGMKVKGMYLIPFLGGAAVTSDRIKTRWENVFISMMGPFYGLIMTLVFVAVYAVTGHSLAAGLASFSALLNLINLLPIIPLDGGHVLKSIAYSIHGKVGKAVLWFGVALSIFITWQIGLSLFAFLTVIGALDLLFGSSPQKEAAITPLTGPGIAVSALWYLGTAIALIVLILVMANMGIAGGQLVSDILNS